MQDLNKLIISAQQGDIASYNQIVSRFQDMAVAYGYSVLGDFHWAEDAAQEAFVEAFVSLPTLKEPLAFAGWLRRIVFKHCDRLTRKKQVWTAPLDDALAEVSFGDDPQKIVEEQEITLQVRQAIALLPEQERSVTLLFYMRQHSQYEIAEFLEVPLTTVKKRLYTARKKLRENMMKVVQEDIGKHRPSRNPHFANRVQRFLPRLSGMIGADQSLVRSLAVMAEQEQDTDLRQVITQIQQDITGDGQTGMTLSEAMAKYPQMFSQSHIDTIQQGEINGNLKVVLEQLGAR